MNILFDANKSSANQSKIRFQPISDEVHDAPLSSSNICYIDPTLSSIYEYI